MLAPGPVTLVSSMSKGQPNVMTASWITLASLGPTSITVAVQPSRLTHQFVSDTEQFVVNIPVLDHLRVVHEAGMSSGRDGDKFAALGIEPVESSVVEAPRVDGMVGYIECQVRDRLSAGDHDLFIADVVYVATDDQAFDGHWVVGEDSGRLLHHLGADRYAALTDQYRYTTPDEEETE
jgi:flavin reductase (DIM6/NTAB) family NADH-FMN oxidoreductase RutF